MADANGDFTIVGTIDPSLAPGPNTLYIDGTAPGRSNSSHSRCQSRSLWRKSTAPVFTSDSPPLTGTVDRATPTHSSPSGNPTPTYAFAASEPSWLTINGTPGPSRARRLRAPRVSPTAWSPPTASHPTPAPDHSTSFAPASTAPVFTSDSPPLTGTVGSSYAYTFVASGNPTPTITEFGFLPRGLSFIANANGTASIAGTLDNGSRGIYVFTLRAKNSVGSTFKTFILIVQGTTRRCHGLHDCVFGSHITLGHLINSPLRPVEATVSRISCRSVEHDPNLVTDFAKLFRQAIARMNTKIGAPAGT